MYLDYRWNLGPGIQGCSQRHCQWYRRDSGLLQFGYCQASVRWTMIRKAGWCTKNGGMGKNRVTSGSSIHAVGFSETLHRLAPRMKVEHAGFNGLRRTYLLLQHADPVHGVCIRRDWEPLDGIIRALGLRGVSRRHGQRYTLQGITEWRHVRVTHRWRNADERLPLPVCITQRHRIVKARAQDPLYACATMWTRGVAFLWDVRMTL